MIEKHTVLILGAGASFGFGYPLGEGLKDRVVHSLGGQFVEHLKTGYGFRPAMKHLVDAFKEDLRKDRALSIDRFLAKHTQDYRILGKVTIAKVIIECEIGQNLFSNNSWYDKLYSIINPYPNLKNLADNKLSIVTFNYDRSLEHFLYERLLGDYGEKRQVEIITVLNKLKIVHVHGRVNPLPWENQQLGIPYGNSGFTPNIFEIAEGLRIPDDNDKQIKEAHTLIEKAEIVYFLGFGYDHTNLEGLGLELLTKCKHVRGTSFGIPIARQGIINKSFSRPIINFFPPEVDVYNFMMNHFDPNTL